MSISCDHCWPFLHCRSLLKTTHPEMAILPAMVAATEVEVMAVATGVEMAVDPIWSTWLLAIIFSASWIRSSIFRRCLISLLASTIPRAKASSIVTISPATNRVRYSASGYWRYFLERCRLCVAWLQCYGPGKRQSAADAADKGVQGRAYWWTDQQT